MPFRPKAKLPDFTALRSTLVGARDQIKDYLLFQTLMDLIDFDSRTQSLLRSDIDGNINTITDISNAEIATVADETVLLPNSRQLIKGSNIDFDDATANEREINVSIHPFLLLGG